MVRIRWELGRIPKAEDFIGRKPSLSTYIRAFETYYDALKAAGIIEKELRGSGKLTDEELLRYLIKFKIDFGRWPHVKDLGKHNGTPNYKTYKRRFTSLEYAIYLAMRDI